MTMFLLLLVSVIVVVQISVALSSFENEILLQHNMYRSLAANAHVQFEPIPNMKLLSWNHALSKQSKELIRSCINNEFETHNDNKQSYQTNIYSYSLHNDDIPLFQLVSNALNSWFSSHRHHNHQKHQNVSCTTCNYYLNMIQAQSKYIGCDIGLCNDELLLICSYDSHFNTASTQKGAAAACTQCATDEYCDEKRALCTPQMQPNAIQVQTSLCNHHCVDECMNILSTANATTTCMDYCVSSPSECYDEHIMKRRLVKRLSSTEDCCYHYVNEYMITISVSFQIFDDKTHVAFENYTDSTVSQIIPLILYQLVIDNQVDNVNNFSISADKITSSEYAYYVDINTDSNSHMIRFRTYASHQLYSDYTEQYANISLLAVMLQSSIAFTSNTEETLVFIGARNETETNDSVEDASRSLVSDNGINYEILNEWYFILILLVSVIGIVICVAVLVKHYYSGSGYDSVELIESGLRNNDIGHRVSVASCCSPGGYDRSVAYDANESERLSHRSHMSHLQSVHSESENGDEQSLLNADNGETVEPDAYLSYNPNYGL